MSRPNVLVQSLDETPQLGYAAVDYSICDDQYLARWVRPDRDGRTVYMFSRDSAHEGVFLWSAALEVFELRLVAHPNQQASLLTLLENDRLEILGTDGDRIACRWEDTLEDGSICEQILQIDATGFAQQASATIYPADPSQSPITSDWLVLATQEYCGVTVATDIAVIVDNPNVAAAPGRTVQRLTLSSIRPAAGDVLAGMCVFPELRNANVTELHADGTRTRRIYDADGTEIGTERFGAYAAGHAPGVSGQRAVAWEWITLPGAAAFLMLGLVAVRAGYRAR